MYGGEIGIRTLGTGEGTTDFESVPFGHSGISPTARMITGHCEKAKPFGTFFSCYQALAWFAGLKRHAQAVGDFFVGFDDVTEALAEAVLVHLLAGVLVPQAAAVGAEFVAQDDFTMEYTEF